MARLGGPPTTGAFDASGVSVCVINRMGREDVGGKPWQAPIPEQNDHGNGAAYPAAPCQNIAPGESGYHLFLWTRAGSKRAGGGFVSAG